MDPEFRSQVAGVTNNGRKDFDWGREGAGCAHCEAGVAMAWFRTRAHTIALCMGCLLEWFPGRSAEWLEGRLDHYMDHIELKIARANPRRRETDADFAPAKWARHPERDPVTGRWSDGRRTS